MRDKVMAEAVMAAALGQADAPQKMERAMVHAEVCYRIFCDCGSVMDSSRAVMRDDRTYCGSSCPVLVGKPARGWFRKVKTGSGVMIDVRRHEDGRCDYRTTGKHRATLSLITTAKQAVKQGYSTWELTRGRESLGQWHTTLARYDKNDPRPPADIELVDIATLEALLLKTGGVK